MAPEKRNALYVTVIFSVLGPVLGALSLFPVAAFFLTGKNPIPVFRVLLNASFYFGGIPALITGLATGLLILKHQSVSLSSVCKRAAVTLLLWILVLLIVLSFRDTTESPLSVMAFFAPFLAFASFCATVFCWFICRKLKLL